MEKQTKTLLAALAAILTLSATLVACHDDLEGEAKYNDGYLHLKFLFDDQGAWNEDGTPKNTTRLLEPIEMESSIEGGMPLYLHCVESSVIEFDEPTADTTAVDTAVTRGERITGEAFDSRNKIQRFGLYLKMSNGEKVLPITTEIARSSLDPEGGWQIKEQDLTFAGDGHWDTKTGDFYAFAPFPGYDSNNSSETDFYNKGYAQCISVDDTPDIPTITFTMQPEEWRNKDILTAKKTGVTQTEKDAGVELNFQHILTAVKFKFTDDNAIKYKVGVSSSATTTYVLKVKKVKLVGIYSTGTAKIGEKLEDANRTTYWTKDYDETTGDCEAEINRTTAQITGDENIINTDEHCFMVLPQTTPAGAKVQFICDLYAESNTANTGDPVKKDIAIEADIDNKVWLAGYSYTYKISQSSEQRLYTLTSVPESNFSFTISGGNKDFDVLSQVQTLKNGATSTAPAYWHLEYSTDNGTKWEKGLPAGFVLTDKSDGTQVSNLDEIDGSTSAKTYTLTAPERIDMMDDDLTNLQAHDYSSKVGSDGYYDLSTHGIGWNAEQCSRSTANCYIINGYGKFKLPLVYGNAIKKGLDNKVAYAYEWPYNSTYDSSSSDTKHHVFCSSLGTGQWGDYITNPYINADLNQDATSASIVWIDEDNVIREGSVKIQDTTEPIKIGTDAQKAMKKQYLTFEIRKDDVRPANIVLAAKASSGRIMWSWHIWVTSYDYTKTVTLGSGANSMKIAKWNLGWRLPEYFNASSRTVLLRVVQNDPAGESVQHTVSQAGGSIALGGSNIIYQHGRKDPFPNSTVSVKSVSGSTITYMLNDEFKLPQGGDRIILDAAYYEVHKVNRNPNRFFNHDQFYAGTFLQSGLKTFNGNTQGESEIYMPWAVNLSPSPYTRTTSYTKITKSIYDPCPVGYVVPNSGLASLLNGLTYTYTEKENGINVAVPYIRYISDDEKDTLTFYMNGCRRKRFKAASDKDENGNVVTSDSFGLTEFRENGYIWMAPSYNYGYSGDYIHISHSGTSGTMIAKGNGDYRCHRGFAIRPVVDEIEQVEALSGGTTQHVRQLDWEGVELTKTTNTTTAFSSILGLITEEEEKWGISNIAINARFNESVEVIENGSTVGSTTLNSFIGNTTYQDKSVYLRKVRVYFTYDDKVYSGRTTTPIRIRIRPLYGTETYSQSAFIQSSEIGTWDDTENCYYYEFTPKWERFKLEDRTSSPYTGLNDWRDIIPLERLRNVTVKKVEVDIRVTYVE